MSPVYELLLGTHTIVIELSRFSAQCHLLQPAKDVPGAEVHILDAGHFALDEQASEVIRLTEAFLKKLQAQ